MRLFTKLRAEQIRSIHYPLGNISPTNRTNPLPDFGNKLDMRQIVGVEAAASYQDPIINQANQPTVQPSTQPVIQPDNTQPYDPNYTNNIEGAPLSENDTPDGEVVEPATEMIVITTITGDGHELPKADLLFSPLVAAREDDVKIRNGDWYVRDFDILTDKPISKIYDAATFSRYFKASIGG